MKRHLAGLSQTALPPAGITDDLYLVRVQAFRYRWGKQKPHYAVEFAVVEPQPMAGRLISGRFGRSPKNLWKLAWFLRDFGYDAELLGRDELDEGQILGLRGMVKISQTVVSGRCSINLDAFAPASQWEAFSSRPPGGERISAGRSSNCEPEVA